MIDVQYLIGTAGVKKTLDGEHSFLLSDGSFYYHNWKTRNGGWFVYDNGETFRIAAELRTPSPHVSSIHHQVKKIELRRNNVRELYQVAENTMIWKSNTALDTDIVLDVKKIGDERQWGRHYDIDVQDNKTIIKFTKKTDQREDKTNGQLEYEMFVVLNTPARVLKRWEERVYEDETHDTQSYSRLVFRAVRLWTTSLVLTASQNLQQALDANEKWSKGRISQNNEQHAEQNKPIENVLSAQALKQFITKEKIITAIPDCSSNARSELIALKAIAMDNSQHAVKRIIHYARALMNDGRLTEHEATEARCADGAGWLFKRCGELIDSFSSEEKSFLSEKIADVIETLHERQTKDGLAFDNPMLGMCPSESRSHVTIEMQALRLATYRCAHNLTKNMLYKELEDKLQKKVRDHFWNGQQLSSGLGDSAPHPSIFLAEYIYPDLLTKEEWSICFTNLLKNLWLDWGGIAMHDTNSTALTDNRSYFWLNNVTAIALHNTNSELFKRHIEKIHNASKSEFLWHGCLGAHGEYSPAARLDSRGNPADLLSTATFVELLEEIKT